MANPNKALLIGAGAASALFLTVAIGLMYAPDKLEERGIEKHNEKVLEQQTNQQQVAQQVELTKEQEKAQQQLLEQQAELERQRLELEAQKKSVQEQEVVPPVQAEPLQVEQPVQEVESQKPVEKPVANEVRVSAETVQMSPLVKSELGFPKYTKDVVGTLQDKKEYLSANPVLGQSNYSLTNMLTIETAAGKVFQFQVTTDSYTKLIVGQQVNVQYNEYDYRGNTITEVLAVSAK